MVMGLIDSKKLEILNILKELDYRAEYNAKVIGRSGIENEIELLIEGKEKLGIAFYDKVSAIHVLRAMIIRYDTGIDQLLIYNRADKEAIEVAKEGKIPLIKTSEIKELKKIL